MIDWFLVWHLGWLTFLLGWYSYRMKFIGKKFHWLTWVLFALTAWAFPFFLLYEMLKDLVRHLLGK